MGPERHYRKDCRTNLKLTFSDGGSDKFYHKIIVSDSGVTCYRMRAAMSSETGSWPLATILRDRRVGLALTGTLGLHIVLVSLHLPSWQCPFFTLTGIPCPGCGLTRACMLLLKGDFQASFRFHAFAPVFIVFISILIVSTLLPRSVVEPLIHKTETLERRTGLTIIILGGLILYWLARLVFFPTMFARLIRG